MSLTPTQTRRRRTKAQLAHIGALAALTARADRIRYACEQLAATGQQITPQLVRTWLAEHDVAEDPDDERQRSYVSRTITLWRTEHPDSATAPDSDTEPADGAETDAAQDPARNVEDPSQAGATDPQVHEHSSPADTDTPVPSVHPTVHTPVHNPDPPTGSQDPSQGAGTDPQVHGHRTPADTDTAPPSVHPTVHTPHLDEVPQDVDSGAGAHLPSDPPGHADSTPDPATAQVNGVTTGAHVHVHSTRAGASTPTPSAHPNGPDPVHTRVHTDTLNGAAETVPEVHALLHDLCTQVGASATTTSVHTPVHNGVHTTVHPNTPPAPGPELVKRSRRVRYVAYGLLAVVAVAGAVLSYDSLATKAREYFPPELAHMFPVLVDLLIVGASLAFLAGAMIGRGRPGWRLLAHAGVVGTVTLNALASSSAAGIPWHVTPAIVWAVLVELIARDLLGDYRATHARPDRIPLALWLTAPGESASTWLRVRRQQAHASARTDVGTHAAALEALRMALPGLRARRVRRIIARQLRAGSVSPQAVLEQATALMQNLTPGSPNAVLRDVLTRTTQPPAKPTQ